MFCAQSDISYDAAHIMDVLEFLSKLHFDEKLSYSAPNCARSALSSYLLPSSEHQSVGSHPLVSRFMRGVFNSNPPRPRYTEIWDVGVVLIVLHSWSPATFLSLLQLTHKVAMLMALVSAQRVQSLQKLRLDRMLTSASGITFFVHDPIKQSRPGTSGLKLQFIAYPLDPKLCVVAHLQQYIKVTKGLRGSELALLVSHKKPHKRVSAQTISRWLKQVLGDSGVDTKMFKSHSTRAADTSAARVMDVPLDQILSAAGWSSARTFQTFYNKPLARPSVFAN